MSTLCPYSIIKGDDGLSVKVEWDVHYLTDEQIGIVRKYVAEIEAENAALRELVRRLYWMADFCRNCPDSERCDVDVEWLGCTVGDPIKAQMEELGVEV